MEPVQTQFITFLNTAIGGIVIGLLFDLYRMLRGVVRPKRLLTDLGDLLFWAIATAVMFIILINDSWGQVRIYVFLGWLVGLLLYRTFLSTPALFFLWGALKVCRLFVDAIARGLSVIRRVASWPFSLAGYRLRQSRRRRARLNRSTSRPVKGSARRGRGAGAKARTSDVIFRLRKKFRKKR